MNKAIKALQDRKDKLLKEIERIDSTAVHSFSEMSFAENDKYNMKLEIEELELAAECLQNIRVQWSSQVDYKKG